MDPRDAAAVLAALTQVLCRLCGRERLSLDADTPLDEIAGLDSLRVLQAVALLEERFGVEVETGALDGLAVVGDVLAALAVARRGGAQGGRG